jgi:hypothetical protein
MSAWASLLKWSVAHWATDDGPSAGDRGPAGTARPALTILRVRRGVKALSAHVLKDLTLTYETISHFRRTGIPLLEAYAHNGRPHASSAVAEYQRPLESQRRGGNR